jgi:FkbM family methyltransferase
MSNEFFELDLLLQFPYQNVDEPILVDVGAHVGLFSKPFAKQRWQVLAFEPEPSNHAELNKRFKDLDNVKIINKAVSNETKAAEQFYISKEHWGIHSLKPFHNTHEPITVETVRLDQALIESGIKEISLLKIDTEGADFWVLQSCDFNKIKPEIAMCEFGDRRSLEYFGYSHHDIVAYMKTFGYKAFVSEWKSIGQGYATQGQKVSSNKFIGCYPYFPDNQPAWGNLIFVREDSVPIFERYLDRQNKGVNNTSSHNFCPACHAQLMAKLGNVLGRKSDKYIPMYYCLQCQSVFNTSDYEPDETQLIKEKDWYISVEERDIQFAENLMQKLLKLRPKTKNILQFGCGIGSVLSVAEKYGDRVTGYDTNQYAIDYGAKKLDLDLRHGSINSNIKGKYDLILSISTLRQEKRPRYVFKELANLAKKNNAALFVALPFFGKDKWNYLLEENLSKKGSPFFDNDVVRTHFSEAGFLKMAEHNQVKKSTLINTNWQGYLFEF